MPFKPERLFGYENTDENPCYLFCQEFQPKEAHKEGRCTCFDSDNQHNK